MTAWTAQELAGLGSADEIGIASRRPDGSVRPFVTIWVVRVGDDLFVRSARGPDNPWFARALAAGTGRVRGGGAEWDVSFETPGPDVSDAIDAAYHAKYDRYGAGNVRTMTSADASRATLRLVPRRVS